MVGCDLHIRLFRQIHLGRANGATFADVNKSRRFRWTACILRALKARATAEIRDDVSARLERGWGVEARSPVTLGRGRTWPKDNAYQGGGIEDSRKELLQKGGRSTEGICRTRNPPPGNPPYSNSEGQVWRNRHECRF